MQEKGKTRVRGEYGVGKKTKRLKEIGNPCVRRVSEQSTGRKVRWGEGKTTTIIRKIVNLMSERGKR